MLKLLLTLILILNTLPSDAKETKYKKHFGKKIAKIVTITALSPLILVGAGVYAVTKAQADFNARGGYYANGCSSLICGGGAISSVGYGGSPVIDNYVLGMQAYNTYQQFGGPYANPVNNPWYQYK